MQWRGETTSKLIFIPAKASKYYFVVFCIVSVYLITKAICA